ncbi:23S rRNA (adenine(2503)-C(2))-methyltransferase RlmN [Lentisphaera profundi]|uniref:23S rRNA (Adenine(2503)-C(2))-methyltransferase RlmN n=1 Tax=Lentisphaera profundi TaxID=1658616 RepID=A0ABY7VQC1_9BACT|nr:23S rRNA (adenine(2503)-C(2))-methyltransferase RlmN [Lentisphaera profundi]WDE96016.1 23S rRNA (adenine(2503)-C(2))-methyltransferase RlmN [Lentisphaera profundi]
MNSERIQAIVDEYKLPKFRAKQLKEAFFEHHYSSFEQLTNFPKDLRNKLTQENQVLCLTVNKVFASSDKVTYKALLELHDGLKIESVLMSPKPGLWTACISSQVGCAMKCTFCATGTMGLTRNLSSEEISDQVLFWRQFIAKNDIDTERLNNVVYMGMGEPLHNTKQVFASIEELTTEDTFKIGSRHISVSTSGLLKGVKEMAERFPQVNLALSLHAAKDELRSSIMPINDAFNLERVRACLDEYIDKTHRKVFIEYVLLEGENNELSHAAELCDFLKSLERPELTHTNLIVYNETDSTHKGSTRQKADDFRNFLKSKGLSVTIRKNLGRDIDGACGQLAVKEDN